jgi:DNA repair exonuclease SbcCD nuclease subunit
MITKIAHIADIHFRNIQRHIEFRAVCSNFIDQMKKIRPDRIVIAGDIVHSKNQISPELVNEVSWFITECSLVTKKVIIIPGNHDIVEQNKDRMDALTPIIGALGLDNVHYYTKSEVVHDENVAWAVYSIFDNHAKPEELFHNSFNGKNIIGLFHGLICGAVNEMGFTFTHGVDIERFSDCHIVLCGDIHKRQILKTKSGVDVIYPGSMVQQNYGETVSQHGYGVLNITEKGFDYKLYDIENPVKYLSFKITDFSDIEEGCEMLTNA